MLIKTRLTNTDLFACESHVSVMTAMMTIIITSEVKVHSVS